MASETPQVLAVARAIPDREVVDTPDIAELRHRVVKLNVEQTSASSVAEQHANFLETQRARLTSLKAEFESLTHVRVALAADAIRSGDLTALEWHEERQRAKALELERLEIAMPTFERELESARRAVGAYGPRVNALQEQIADLVRVEKIRLARARVNR